MAQFPILLAISGNMPPASTGPSCLVSPTGATRAPDCRARDMIRAMSVVEACEASSITRTSAGPTGTRLAKNRVMFHASLSPSPCMTLAAFSLSVRPMTRPPVMAAQARAKAAIARVFPAPAGATRQVTNRPLVSIPLTACRCS